MKPEVKRALIVNSEDSARDSEGEICPQLLWAIFSAAKDIKDIQNYWAKKLGLTGPHWNIVRALRDNDCAQTGITGAELATIVHVNPSFISAQVKLLEAKGWILRRRSSKDERNKLLSLTLMAFEKIEMLRSSETILAKALVDDIHAIDLATFLNVCSILRKNVAKTVLISQISF